MALTKISRSLLDTGVSDSSDATAITIDSSERILIGTTNTYNAEADNLIIYDSGNAGLTIATGSTSGNNTIHFADGTSGDAQYRGVLEYEHNDDSMRFKVAGEQEAMRILSSQHLLVGTTSEYSGTNGNITAVRQIDIGANDANSKTLFFHRNAATGDIGGIAAGVTGFSTMGRIDFVAENVSGGAQASSIRFKTTDSATESLQWQITQYGTLNPNGNNAKNIGDTSNRVSVIYTSNAVNVSDQTLKTEIEDCDLGLDFINTLQPKSYKNLQSVGVALQEGHDDYNRKHYGLIAQDLKDGSLSDSVYGAKDGEYSLAYNDLIAPLIKALQEADDKIEALTARITTLEG